MITIATFHCSKCDTWSQYSNNIARHIKDRPECADAKRVKHEHRVQRPLLDESGASSERRNSVLLTPVEQMTPFNEALVISAFQKAFEYKLGMRNIHAYTIRANDIFASDRFIPTTKELVATRKTPSDVFVHVARFVFGDLSIPEGRFMWRLNGTDTIGAMFGMQYRILPLHKPWIPGYNVPDMLSEVNKRLVEKLREKAYEENDDELIETFKKLHEYSGKEFQLAIGVDTKAIWTRIREYIPTMEISLRSVTL